MPAGRGERTTNCTNLHECGLADASPCLPDAEQTQNVQPLTLQ